MGSHASLRSTVIITVSAGFVIVAAGGVALAHGASRGPAYPAKAVVIFAIVAALASTFVRSSHPFPTFGAANAVTTARAALVALVAAFIGEGAAPAQAAAIVTLATAVTVLDGVDGWIARRTGMGSDFGARFDMETDALLILALSILTCQYGKAGAWVVLSGLLRYLFVAAGWVWAWMKRPLPPRFRRKMVCVVQIVALLIALLPAVVPPASRVIAAASLALLAWSFGVDTAWLAGYTDESR